MDSTKNRLGYSSIADDGDNPTNIDVLAIPNSGVTEGYYRLTLARNRITLNQPSATASSAEILWRTVAPRTRVTFNNVTYCSTSRAISFTASFTVAPRSFTTSAFVVRRRASPTELIIPDVTATWTITAGPGTTSRLITATPDNTVPAGIYDVSINRHAFEYNQPDNTARTNDITIGEHIAQASWGPVSAPDSDRAVTSTLTFPRNPGSAFVIADDVRIQARSGSAGSYSWTTEPTTEWDRESTGTPTNTSKPVKAIPAPSVEGGTYRFLLLADSWGTGRGGQTSAGFTIGEDMAIPSVTITEGEFIPGTTPTVQYRIYWHSVSATQLTTEFTSSDVTINGVSGARVTVGSRVGNSFLATIDRLPANSTGNVSITIPEDTISNSFSTTSACVNFDTRPAVTPTTTAPSISISADGFCPTNNTAYFRIFTTGADATQAANLGADDITVNVSEGTAPTEVLGARSGGSYPVSIVIPSGRTGSLSITVAEDALGTDTNLEVTSGCIFYDTRSQITFSFGSAYESATGSDVVSMPFDGDPSTVYIEFSANGSVSGLQEGDLIVSGGCSAGLTVRPSNTWRIGVEVPSDEKGRINISIPEERSRTW